MELKDRNGNVMAIYIMAMEARCVYCRREIAIKDGAFVCLGHPYMACLHRECAPFFPFNGAWPHEMPAANYTSYAKPT